jgi:1,4-dihydroxy-2-naphthoate octaprenyltransferase
LRPALATLEVSGVLIVVIQVLRSSEPLSFKVGAVAVPAVILYTILVFHLGRWLERRRLSNTKGSS